MPRSQSLEHCGILVCEELVRSSHENTPTLDSDTKYASFLHPQGEESQDSAALRQTDAELFSRQQNSVHCSHHASWGNCKSALLLVMAFVMVRLRASPGELCPCFVQVDRRRCPTLNRFAESPVAWFLEIQRIRAHRELELSCTFLPFLQVHSYFPDAREERGEG